MSFVDVEVHETRTDMIVGATYSEYFEQTSSVLVCNTVTPGHEKLRHAQLWSVPAVKSSWLWDSICRGELMPFGFYLVQPLSHPGLLLKDPEIPSKPSTSSKPNKIRGKEAPADAAKRWSKKTFSPEEPRQNVGQDMIQPAEHEDTSIKSVPDPSLDSTHTSASRKEEAQDSAIHLDDDASLSIELNLDNDSSNTLKATPISAPLREITPNSSPPKPAPSPMKSLAPIQTKDPPSPKPTSQDSSLGPAISSLLAHHQRSNTHHPSSKHSEEPRPYRRRRQLLGRAPSNLSSHSFSNGINLSRASSVDTMNTDGLGTPLEPSNNNNNNNGKTNKKTEPNSKPLGNYDPMLYSASFDEDPDRVEEPLQMTQLGYEDPTVAAWRERVAAKMSGAKVKEGKPTTTTSGRKSGGVQGDGGLGIAKRTRLATGR